MEKIEIGRCKDCKWWVEGPSELDLDQCDYDAQKFFVERGQDSFHPDSDFGCIHWKEKEGGN